MLLIGHNLVQYVGSTTYVLCTWHICRYPKVVHKTSGRRSRLFVPLSARYQINASYKKSRSSEVKVWAKSNAKINFTSIFSQIVTKLLIDFSKEAIVVLIYLLADKGIGLQKHQ